MRSTPAGDTEVAVQSTSERLGVSPESTRWQELHPTALWRPGAAGDTDAWNGGAISNLLAVREADQVWWIGSGATPGQARALAADLQQRPAPWGAAPTDVVSPWPRPELVLGQAGLPAARSWAHADVAQAMAQRCPRCRARLLERLGQPDPAGHDPSATGSADPLPIRLPDRRVRGDRGRLGPFDWWRFSRGQGTPVTVWWHAASQIATAHGLLWADGAPDLRDSDIASMLVATEALIELSRHWPASLRWLPEQGPLLDTEHGPLAHRRYWLALRQAIAEAQASGQAESAPAPALPGIDTQVTNSLRHRLNWQRAWREQDEFSPDASAVSRAD